MGRAAAEDSLETNDKQQVDWKDALESFKQTRAHYATMHEMNGEDNDAAVYFTHQDCLRHLTLLSSFLQHESLLLCRHETTSNQEEEDEHEGEFYRKIFNALLFARLLLSPLPLPSSPPIHQNKLEQDEQQKEAWLQEYQRKAVKVHLHHSLVFILLQSTSKPVQMQSATENAKKKKRQEKLAGLATQVLCNLVTSNFYTAQKVACECFMPSSHDNNNNDDVSTGQDTSCPTLKNAVTDQDSRLSFLDTLAARIMTEKKCHSPPNNSSSYSGTTAAMVATLYNTLCSLECDDHPNNTINNNNDEDITNVKHTKDVAAYEFAYSMANHAPLVPALLSLLVTELQSKTIGAAEELQTNANKATTEKDQLLQENKVQKKDAILEWSMLLFNKWIRGGLLPVLYQSAADSAFLSEERGRGISSNQVALLEVALHVVETCSTPSTTKSSLTARSILDENENDAEKDRHQEEESLWWYLSLSGSNLQTSSLPSTVKFIVDHACKWMAQGTALHHLCSDTPPKPHEIEHVVPSYTYALDLLSLSLLDTATEELLTSASTRPRTAQESLRQRLDPCQSPLFQDVCAALGRVYDSVVLAQAKFAADSAQPNATTSFTAQTHNQTKNRASARGRRDFQLLTSQRVALISLVRFLGNVCFRSRVHQDALRTTVVPMCTLSSSEVEVRHGQQNESHVTAPNASLAEDAPNSDSTPVENSQSSTNTMERTALHLLLSTTSLSYACVGLREWCLVALRNATEYNQENATFLQQLQPQQVVNQSPELQRMGVKLDLDEKGEVRVVPS